LRPPFNIGHRGCWPSARWLNQRVAILRDFKYPEPSPEVCLLLASFHGFQTGIEVGFNLANP